MNAMIAGVVIALLALGQTPKPTTRETAESRDVNLGRYRPGGFGENATGSLGIEFNYNEPQGITISSFKTDSTAEAAGIKQYDGILEIDGAPVGKLRGRFYEPWKKYGRAGVVTESEMLVTFLREDGIRTYYYPKVRIAGVAGAPGPIRPPLSDDFFTVTPPRLRSSPEDREHNVARYRIGSGNFARYSRFELGVEVDYSYDFGATIRRIVPGRAASRSDGLQAGDMILEVDGAPVGVLGDRVYELWRQYVYNQTGLIELLVCFVDPATREYRYYYPKIQLDRRTNEG